MNITPQTPLSNPQHGRPARDRAAVAVFLIALGAILLVAQWLALPELSLLIPLIIGLGFIVLGMVRREVGFLIPGGILTGVGAGVYLMTGPLLSGTAETTTIGVMLLAFAAGWVLISLLSLLIGKAIWWPLIPAVVIAGFGALFFAGDVGMRLLQSLGQLWPLVLIAIGLWILWRLRQRA